MNDCKGQVPLFQANCQQLSYQLVVPKRFQVLLPKNQRHSVEFAELAHDQSLMLDVFEDKRIIRDIEVNVEERKQILVNKIQSQRLQIIG